MTISRRTFLSALAALPFTGKLKLSQPDTPRLIALQTIAQCDQWTRLFVYSPSGSRDGFKYKYFREISGDRGETWMPYYTPHKTGINYPIDTYPNPGVSYSDGQYRLNDADPRDHLRHIE